jgi:hypothetical protein
MIKPTISSKKHRRKRAKALIRRVAKRRKNELGCELLTHAVHQIADGDDHAARVTLERYELTTSTLSKVDVAILQCARDRLTAQGATEKYLAIAKFFFGFVLKGLPSAWRWIRTHAQIYSINFAQHDPRRTCL